MRIRLENQGGYKQTIDKYVQSSQSGRPDMVMLPGVHGAADGRLRQRSCPVEACFEASDFDTSPFLPKALRTFETEGVQWSMPFNVSNPVLYYLKPVFVAAGLDPADPPVSLEELRATSQAIVDSGAAGDGIALDSGVDSGGGWFIEQWFARMHEPYADNGNGRLAPATQVLYAGPVGVDLMTEVQSLITDGLAVTVGDNPNGQDGFLKLADPASPAAMTIATSAALGHGARRARRRADRPACTQRRSRRRADARSRRDAVRGAGGASLYIVADKGDEKAAAAWDYIQFVTSAQSQSTWAAATGYVPIREDALELEPLKTKYATDPRFKVAVRPDARRRRRRLRPGAGARPGARGALGDGRRRGGDLRRRRPGDLPRRRRRTSPTPSSPTTTPATDPQSGRDPSLGADRLGIRDDLRPDARAFPFAHRRDTQGGCGPLRLQDYAHDHHGLVTREAAERRGVSALVVVPGDRRRRCSTRSIPASPDSSGSRATREQRIAAAVLAAGPGAMASHRSAPTCGASRGRTTTRST